MAEKLVRILDGQPMGKGSFVTFRAPKWKQLKGGLKAFQAAGGESNATGAAMEMMDELLPAMIVAWDWTDEDGKLLPLPSVDRSAWDDLELADVMFLIDKASPLINFDRKN